uniref:Uncharacterized protein n=1 Tax=viral metagenome TaxID=1070528 RepID=A0A6M3K699_9ZZZZ
MPKVTEITKSFKLKKEKDFMNKKLTILYALILMLIPCLLMAQPNSIGTPSPTVNNQSQDELTLISKFVSNNAPKSLTEILFYALVIIFLLDRKYDFLKKYLRKSEKPEKLELDENGNPVVKDNPHVSYKTFDEKIGEIHEKINAIDKAVGILQSRCELFCGKKAPNKN